MAHIFFPQTLIVVFFLSLFVKIPVFCSRDEGSWRRRGSLKLCVLRFFQVQACEYCWSIVDSMWLTILGENSKYKVKFDDPRVCKSFLLGCCPHDILSSTVRIYIPTWFWLSQFVRPFGMYMILRGQFQIKYNQKFFDIMIRNVYLLI